MTPLCPIPTHQPNRPHLPPGSFLSQSYYSTLPSSHIPSHSTPKLPHIPFNSYMNSPSPHLPSPHLSDLTTTNFYFLTVWHQHTKTAPSLQLFLPLQPPPQLPTRLPQPHCLPHLPNHHPTHRPLLTALKQTLNKKRSRSHSRTPQKQRDKGKPPKLKKITTANQYTKPFNCYTINIRGLTTKNGKQSWITPVPRTPMS